MSELAAKIRAAELEAVKAESACIDLTLVANHGPTAGWYFDMLRDEVAPEVFRARDAIQAGDHPAYLAALERQVAAYVRWHEQACRRLIE